MSIRTLPCPQGQSFEAPFPLLFLSPGFEGSERDPPSPKVTQQGREMERGRGPRWAGSPALCPWSPGEPGPQLRGRTERKGEGGCRICVQMVQQAERRVPSTGTPNCRQSHAEATCFAEPARQVPHGPKVQLSHRGLVSRWWMPCGSRCEAVLGSGGGCGGPQSSDEPLLRRQLEVGGWWRSGTHLLLTAGPVGAFRLPLLPQFPHQQHQPHGQK